MPDPGALADPAMTIDHRGFMDKTVSHLLYPRIHGSRLLARMLFQYVLFRSLQHLQHADTLAAVGAAVCLAGNAVQEMGQFLPQRLCRRHGDRLGFGLVRRGQAVFPEYPVPVDL